MRWRGSGRSPARCVETPRTRFPARCLASLPSMSTIRGSLQVPVCCRTPFAARWRRRASLRRGRLSLTRLTSVRRGSTRTLGFSVWRAILVACSCGSNARGVEPRLTACEKRQPVNLIFLAAMFLEDSDRRGHLVETAVGTYLLASGDLCSRHRLGRAPRGGLPIGKAPALSVGRASRIAAHTLSDCRYAF